MGRWYKACFLKCDGKYKKKFDNFFSFLNLTIQIARKLGNQWYYFKTLKISAQDFWRFSTQLKLFIDMFSLLMETSECLLKIDHCGKLWRL